MGDSENKTNANLGGDADAQIDHDQAGLTDDADEGGELDGGKDGGAGEGQNEGQQDGQQDTGKQGDEKPDASKPDEKKSRAEKKAEKKAGKEAGKAKPAKPEQDKGAGFVKEVDELGVPKPSTAPVAELSLKDARAELEHISQGAAVLVAARAAHTKAIAARASLIEKINSAVAEQESRLHKINTRLHRTVNKRVEDLRAHVAALQSDEATKG